MSRYRQFCGVARALELVGDRWALLVVRELLPGPRRFTDLRRGLPGIASNLLVRRLDELQRAGVVERRLATRGQVYALTPFGEGLRGVLHELVRWSAPTMAAGPGPDETFQPAWLATALEAFLDDVRPEAPLVVAFETEGARVEVTLDASGARTRWAGTDRAAVPDGAADASPPRLTLAGPGPLLLGLASGQVPPDDARRRGMVVHGDATALAVLARRPAAAARRSAARRSVARRSGDPAQGPPPARR